MAFAVASKGAALAGLLKNLRLAAPSSTLLRAGSVGATRRVYSTRDGARYYGYQAVGEALVSYHARLAASHLFHPTITPAEAASGRVWWLSKLEEDPVQVQVAMLGLPKERVKVWTNQRGLFIKVERQGVNRPDDPAPYSCHIELSAKEFVLEKTKAEMKDGLLKLTVPRFKGTEIKIE